MFLSANIPSFKKNNNNRDKVQPMGSTGGLVVIKITLLQLTTRSGLYCTKDQMSLGALQETRTLKC